MVAKECLNTAGLMALAGLLLPDCVAQPVNDIEETVAMQGAAMVERVAVEESVLAPRLPPPPPWVATCTQSVPTYIVMVETPGCLNIMTDGGTWNGCELVAGSDAPYCVYKWKPRKTMRPKKTMNVGNLGLSTAFGETKKSETTTLPPVSAYAALENRAVQIPAPRTVAIEADCSDQEFSCGSSLRSGDVDHTCATLAECCAMSPGKGWLCEDENDDSPWCCGTMHPLVRPCGVCGFILEGELHAVMDQKDVGVPAYRVVSGDKAWDISAPQGQQIFTVPLEAPDSFDITIQPKPAE